MKLLTIYNKFINIKKKIVTSLNLNDKRILIVTILGSNQNIKKNTNIIKLI